MKLTDLNPKFLGNGGDGVTLDGEPVPRREGVGLRFDCPCGCPSPCFVYLENPLDGKPFDTRGAPQWKRVGEDFETLTLTPSIQRYEPCPKRWHGFITNGEIITV